METLKLRKISIDTYRENVVYLHRDCPVYRSEGFQAHNKIEIHRADDGTSVIAVLNVVDDEAILAEDELGLSE
jgi:thymidine phosphorylase